MPAVLETKYLSDFIKNSEIEIMQEKVSYAHKILHNKSGLGGEFCGWLDLPRNYNREEFEKIKISAKKIREQSQVLIVIGIGGSYLGARAAIEFLKSANYNINPQNQPKIFFVGNNMDTDYIYEVLEFCQDKDVSINVISKSGTTTEPAIAFRVFKEFLEKKYGVQGARERIYCTTDKEKGKLKELSDKKGYTSFIIPENIGGRFSVLTAVGLLPIAVAGLNIQDLMDGASCAQEKFKNENLEQNDCYKYAAIRNVLNKKGKDIEILVSYTSGFAMFGEWFKQLFGESEGKENKGIFPSYVTFSTDLHSLGQYIQQGKRNLFETVLFVEKNENTIQLKEEKENLDGLNFLSGKTLDYINKKAFQGTILAHTQGGVPNIVLKVPQKNEFELGYLIYFFEKACAISGYILGVNPFNQPGVEAYKKNMFALLGKPGYEKEQEILSKLI